IGGYFSVSVLGLVLFQKITNGKGLKNNKSEKPDQVFQCILISSFMTPYDIAVLKNAKDVAKYLK
ncbi:hypothetical protein BpHYR1_048285, partial [Brachionus plicatilis]